MSQTRTAEDQTLRAQMAAAVQSRKDPQQRSQLLDSYRATAAAMHPDLAELTGIDSRLQPKLFDLLAQQRLTRELSSTEEQLAVLEGRARVPDPEGRTSLTLLKRERSELLQLLGLITFRRYLAYLESVTERAEVTTFNVGLAEQRLSSEQKQQLVDQFLWRRYQRPSAHPTGVLPIAPAASQGADLASLERLTKLIPVQESERELEIDIRLSQEVVRRAARFLSGPQQAAFEAFQAKQLERLRDRVRSLRREAGLDPEQAAPPSVLPRPLERALQWTLTLTIDGQPQTTTFNTRAGEMVTFKTSQGLSAEAVATPYDDARMHVKVMLFEVDEVGRHRLGALEGNGPLEGVTSGAGGIMLDSPYNTVMAGVRAYTVKRVSVSGKLQ